MSNWFDDFMVMKILEDDSTTDESDDFTSEEDQEDTTEAEEALEALRDELSTLQDELSTIECNEPNDLFSDAYNRWEVRHSLLEEQIADVEVAIAELEEQLGI